MVQGPEDHVRPRREPRILRVLRVTEPTGTLVEEIHRQQPRDIGVDRDDDDRAGPVRRGEPQDPLHHRGVLEHRGQGTLADLQVHPNDQEDDASGEEGQQGSSQPGGGPRHGDGDPSASRGHGDDQDEVPQGLLKLANVSDPEPRAVDGAEEAVHRVDPEGDEWSHPRQEPGGLYLGAHLDDSGLLVRRDHAGVPATILN
mmetsp:Transcript_57202/g.163009  ORF Transcript_57202/g.163009 Transcript_57202/m.163009 type:complete len:200 (+) Transcript_57202:1413-2012(+)